MKKDRSRLLIPCYRDMDAYDIPDELSNLQSQDMSKVGFMQDILRGVKVESLMKRGFLFLEDSDWRQANEYFNKVLDIDPEYAPAYIGLLCAELNVKNEADFANHKESLDDRPNYQKALRFADENYREKIGRLSSS